MPHFINGEPESRLWGLSGSWNSQCRAGVSPHWSSLPLWPSAWGVMAVPWEAARGARWGNSLFLPLLGREPASGAVGQGVWALAVPSQEKEHNGSSRRCMFKAPLLQLVTLATSCPLLDVSTSWHEWLRLLVTPISTLPFFLYNRTPILYGKMPSQQTPFLSLPCGCVAM